MSAISIFDYVPEGTTLRETQIKILTELEAAWDKNDVFVLEAPTGAGKSILAIIIARWQEARSASVGIITPMVALQDQYKKDFPEIPSLKGKVHFDCEFEPDWNCGTYYDWCNNLCDGCPYKAERNKVKKSDIAIFNFHSYISQKERRNILIIDEAHLASKIITSFYTSYLYKCLEHYPKNLNTHGDMSLYLEERSKELKKEGADLVKADDMIKAAQVFRRADKFETTARGLSVAPASYYTEHETLEYRGKKTPAIRIEPKTVEGLPHGFWPRKHTHKIILMSGTISWPDVKKLGLYHRKVAYLSGGSPIPTESRPIVYERTANMAYKHQKLAIPMIAKKINRLAEKHADEKGVVHVPYALQSQLRPHMPDSRFIWHGKENKKARYQEFRNAKKPKILIASGMAEGIDLADDAARWQVIPKVMFPSLADGLMKQICKEDSKYYSWLTIRTIIQQCGRVCRGPNDYGVSYILDSNFEHLYNYNTELFMDYFKDALKGVK